MTKMKETKIISYGKRNTTAEIVVKHMLNDGKYSSVTKHVHHIGGGVYRDWDKKRYIL